MRQGAEAEGDGGGAVVVHPGPYGGEGDQQHSGDAGDDAGQAVHVVAGRGRRTTARSAISDEQHAAADESGAAQQLVAPQRAVAGDGGGDGVGDVVEDGGRQRLGERAQAEHLAVEDALGGERAGAVQDGAVAAHQVVADRGALGRALAGEPQDLRVDVGDRDVLGQGHVDPAVGRDDGDPAEAGAVTGAPEPPPVPWPVAAAEAVVLTCESPSFAVSHRSHVDRGTLDTWAQHGHAMLTGRSRIAPAPGLRGPAGAADSQVCTHRAPPYRSR